MFSLNGKRENDFRSGLFFLSRREKPIKIFKKDLMLIGEFS